jgi:hypothetical protein
MDGKEQVRAAIIGGLDYLAQVCIVCACLVHSGVMDGMPELLQLGDKGLDNRSVDLALSEAFILGSVSSASCCMPCVDTYLNGSHPLST